MLLIKRTLDINKDKVKIWQELKVLIYQKTREEL